ncbi:MAG: GGDEF domain-containing protein [Cyanobacteria bacterium SBLK]|nr:GGDEF domain-containing protein [Cyanobacteria bacterium SBLK]
MNVSVLLVGGKHFTTIFLDRYETPSATVVEATSKAKIIACVGQKRPDIVLLEANLLEVKELCWEIKKANPLGWVYCLAIEFSAEIDTFSRCSSQHLLDTAEAIENHADAYLQLSGLETPSDRCLEAEQRLLLAYLQVAYRQVRQYRDLLQTNDFLSSIALSDALTNLSNRRAFEWDLPRQIQKARKRETSLSLAILDVDYFKSVNDTHGHLVGDRVLQLLALRLRKNIRMQDTIFRYGGEEFVILFQQTNAKTAVAIAHRLCQMIAETPFKIDCHLTLPVTVSIGLSLLQDEDDNRGITLLQRADLNLLKAKSSGRNRIIH